MASKSTGLKTVTQLSTLKAASVLAFALSSAGARAADWDTAQAQGPSIEVLVDTTSGTWMNVDVSPDGKTIAFDLLGDVFVMPITGGTAKSLLSGAPYEHQPRFSPDGRHIAFTSDRSGAENVWVMAVDGTGLRQITQEDFRTASGPAWSPDGRSIIVRKHFTGTRSIGTGQLWSFPFGSGSGGGVGVRLFAGPSYQKDVNEPVFSPDGKSIFFSQDVTPGDLFEYDRDPYKGIFAIRRLSLDSNEVATGVAGPGGAVRPTPSPDGRWLAYVRRAATDAAGNSSALILREMASGAEKTVFVGLNQDQQELWANHGYYPAFAWTPDSAALIFWSRGKIRQLAIAGGGVQLIPFSVKQVHRVIQPPRTSASLHGADFAVKALRWTQVSPTHDKIAFQALGKIYVRDLRRGTLRRLTRDEDRLEFYPTFSPDGQWIVYTSWNDQALGSVRRTRIKDGSTVILVDGQGAYVEPSVSPDGQRVWYRRVGADELRSPRWTEDPGLYEIEWGGGGPPQRRSAEGRIPQACGSGGDLYFVTSRQTAGAAETSSEAVTQVLMRLKRGTTQVVAQTPFASEYRLSPDCRWLAWAEHDDISVVPLRRDGGEEILPLSAADLERRAIRVKGDGGAFLSWSNDGALHWTLGATLFSWTPEGHSVSHREIGFRAPVIKASGATLLKGGRLLTLRGEEVIADGAILIEGDRITKIGRSGSFAAPPQAHLVELAGRTVIPGLIDSHWHGRHDSGGLQPQQNWNYFATLALGVTTLLDPAASDAAFSSGELARSGRILAPRILTTGTFIYGPRSQRHARIESLEDALKYARRRRAWGGWFLKSYLLPRREQQRQLIAAARLEGLMVLAEGNMGPLNSIAQIIDGTNGIEHGIPLTHVYDDVIQLWSRTGVDVTPTLVVSSGGIGGDNYNYQLSEVWKHPILSRLVPPDVLRSGSIRRPFIREADNRSMQAGIWVNRLAQAGTRVLAGGHGQREGLSLHWELALLIKGGMTPHQVLAAATIRSAEHLGLGTELGSIEVGKIADLVVLDADPLADIRHTEKVAYVISSGRIFNPTDMSSLDGKRRKPFFWEDTHFGEVPDAQNTHDIRTRAY